MKKGKQGQRNVKGSYLFPLQHSRAGYLASDAQHIEHRHVSENH